MGARHRHVCVCIFPSKYLHMFVKVASVPVIRLRLAIIRLTLAPNRDDALVIVVLDICICMCICCQVSKMTERIRAHNVHPVPTGRLPLDLGYITAHPVGGSSLQFGRNATPADELYSAFCLHF